MLEVLEVGLGEELLTRSSSPILHAAGGSVLLAAHLVPGYFVAMASQPRWQADWSNEQRIMLWVAAFFSTFAPDLDVIYNWLFRGFFNHSVLWTHSIFLHLGTCLCWWLLFRSGRWPYVQILVGLTAIGGLSHLALDVILHGTPLFYPFSRSLIGTPSARVLQGGFWGYITDPIFLLEPLILSFAAAHWIVNRRPAPRVKRLALCGLVAALVVFSGAFLLLLPTLRRIIVI